MFCFYLIKIKAHLREDVLDANNYAAQVMKHFKLDLLDLHYYFHKQTVRRKNDGIHWDAPSHRRITNLILNHLCESWDIESPGRILIKNDNRLIDLGASRESDNDEEWSDLNDNNREYNTSENEYDYNKNIKHTTTLLKFNSRLLRVYLDFRSDAIWMLLGFD